MTGRLFVSAGDVVDVQLAAEPFADDSDKKKKKKPNKKQKAQRAPERGPAQKRMRVFLREGDGKDHKYDFDGAHLGVRVQQRVAVVRGVLRGAREPVNLMLCNLSTGEREMFERALAMFLVTKPGFPPIAQALVGAGALWVLTVLAMKMFIAPGASFTAALWYGAFVAFVMFWLFWAIMRGWSDMTARGRLRRARDAFIADIETRVKAYAPSMRG